jgi:transcription elongation factor Elf1
MSHHVDGNAAIGALSLALGTDVGAGTLECAGCGNTHEIARTHVYLRCPGMVLRCPGCGAVEVVVVEIRHRLTATLSGIAALRTGPAAGHTPAPA